MGEVRGKFQKKKNTKTFPKTQESNVFLGERKQNYNAERRKNKTIGSNKRNIAKQNIKGRFGV